MIEEEAQLKLVLIRTILEGLEVRDIKLREAADMADVSYVRLYRMHSGVHKHFSIGWLLRVAKRTGIDLRICVQLM